MYHPSTNWVEQIKFMIHEVTSQKSFVLEGVVTSVDPDPPCQVKVMLEPYRIETGWLRLASPFLGKGYGLVLPPPEEGTPVKVIFDMGDLKNGTVVGSVPNDASACPQVPSGTAGLVHPSGSSFLIGPDGSLSLVHASGSYLKLLADGTVEIKGSQSPVQRW